MLLLAVRGAGSSWPGSRSGSCCSAAATRRERAASRTPAARSGAIRDGRGAGASDVQELETKPKWNSFPPTSGAHYSSRRSGTSTTTRFCSCRPSTTSSTAASSSTTARMFPRRDRQDARVVSRRPERDAGRAAARLKEQDRADRLDDARHRTGGEGGTRAWLACELPRLRRRRVQGFRDAHRYKGPERFHPSTLHPGT